MDSFIAVAHGWPPHATPQSSNGGRPYGHFRSLSSLAKSPSPKPSRPLGKSPSASELTDMVDSPRLRPLPPSPNPEDAELSTLPDPRSRTMSPAIEPSPSAHHPDLNAEVASLSTKLVNALNYQTTLDDTLSDTRAELDRAQEQIRTLEERNATQREMLSGDVWVRKKSVEQEKQKLLSRVAAEKGLREEAEKEKKRIEQELENLTQALFEEANKMVISAKEEAQRDYDALQKKNDQLRAQLSDNEALLKSQQDQLTQLKHVMEQMTNEREERTTLTAPSSPGLSKSDFKEHERPVSRGAAPQSATLEPTSPTYPTSFNHLITPVLKTDMASYEDFAALARTSLSRKQHGGNRASSGSMNTAYKLGFGLGGNASSAHASNGSTSSLPNVSTPVTASSPQTPNTPASVASAASHEPATPPPPLKETKFFKRALSEDVEPTLRLDIAPGLSWLARRSVLSAMADGSIVVEPIPTNSPLPAYIKPQHYPCSLCGETRKDDQYLRYHRFRTSESDTAQRYPLCRFCLGRVRSTCDFLSFLRILKDGHWRAEGDDPEKVAWEESVRLREQMFWSRIGGGVIPTGHPVLADNERSPRPSHEVGPTSGAQQPPIETVETPATPINESETLHDGGVSLEQSLAKDADADVDADADERPTTPSPTNRNSTQTIGATENTATNGEEPKRLSITIPKAEMNDA